MTCTCSTFDSFVKIGVSVDTSQWYGPAASKSIFFNCSCSSLEFFHCLQTHVVKNEETKKRLISIFGIRRPEIAVKANMIMQIDLLWFRDKKKMFRVSCAENSNLRGSCYFTSPNTFQPKIEMNSVVVSIILVSNNDRLVNGVWNTHIDFCARNGEISIGRCSIFNKLEDFLRTITQPCDLESESKKINTQTYDVLDS